MFEGGSIWTIFLFLGTSAFGRPGCRVSLRYTWSQQAVSTLRASILCAGGALLSAAQGVGHALRFRLSAGRGRGSVSSPLHPARRPWAGWAKPILFSPHRPGDENMEAFRCAKAIIFFFFFAGASLARIPPADKGKPPAAVLRTLVCSFLPCSLSAIKKKKTRRGDGSLSDCAGEEGKGLLQ